MTPQALDQEKVHAVRGREMASELDAVAYANKDLQHEFTSLQRKMQDKQDFLRHEVRCVLC